jgi:hypothetical protein
MRRRDFIALVGGAAAVWPLSARAQQPAMPLVGFLYSLSPEPIADRLRGFRQGLKPVGYVEGENVAVVYRFAENRIDRLPELTGRIGPPPSRGDCRRQHPLGVCRQGGNLNDPNRLFCQRGPGQAWSCGQHCPTRRQPDRHQFSWD